MVRFIQKAFPSVDAVILMIYRTMSTTFETIYKLFSLAISMPTILYLPSIMRARVNSILSNLCQLLLFPVDSYHKCLPMSSPMLLL